MTATSSTRLPKTSRPPILAQHTPTGSRESTKTHSTAWQDRLSEPNSFAKTILEWPDDVNFCVAYNGCDGKLLCADISERIENRTRARQVCYLSDSFRHMSWISAQIHVGVLALLDLLVELTVWVGTKQSSPSRW